MTWLVMFLAVLGFLKLEALSRDAGAEKQDDRLLAVCLGIITGFGWPLTVPLLFLLAVVAVVSVEIDMRKEAGAKGVT